MPFLPPLFLIKKSDSHCIGFLLCDVFWQGVVCLFFTAKSFFSFFNSFTTMCLYVDLFVFIRVCWAAQVCSLILNLVSFQPFFLGIILCLFVSFPSTMHVLHMRKHLVLVCVSPQDLFIILHFFPLFIGLYNSISLYSSLFNWFFCYSNLLLTPLIFHFSYTFHL